jgi:hypothetical protein
VQISVNRANIWIARVRRRPQNNGLEQTNGGPRSMTPFAAHPECLDRFREAAVNRSSSSKLAAGAERMLVVGCIVVSASRALCQEGVASQDAVRPRATSLLFGVGNALGWLGGQGEKYFHGDRVSVFFGLGYTISTEEGCPSGVTAAAGARVFTSGRSHRALLELSISQIATEIQIVDGEKYPGSRRYGPGVQVGYQFVSRGGFTALLSGGVGYALGASPGLSRTHGVANLAIGYTWRH